MTRAATTLRTADGIIAAGIAPESARAAITSVAKRYSVAVTPAMANLMTANDDPIARQFIPGARELVALPAERPDPIGDRAHSPIAGIVHRYDDRVLLKIASVCPVYCRFCFRREMVGPERGKALSAEVLTKALDYIRATPAIREVILTGGDPFVLSPRRVREATEALGAIPHVQILRWHTRVPVVDPSRVTDDFIAALMSTRKAVVVAAHSNHLRELTAEARNAIGRLADAGISLLSQSVLLKGVNDTADGLEALMRAFIALRIRPYYLHHGDLAPGTSHFRTTIHQGRELMRELARRLPGNAMPRYMLDIPGGFGKIDLMGPDVIENGGAYRVTDRFGAAHEYRDACSQ